MFGCLGTLLLTMLSYRLLRRASQTLWKPVPELINILGVDVPDAPDVVLSGIGLDKATVSWARPHPSKPVHKFLIQVNGVVGKQFYNGQRAWCWKISRSVPRL